MKVERLERWLRLKDEGGGLLGYSWKDWSCALLAPPTLLYSTLQVYTGKIYSSFPHYDLALNVRINYNKDD